MLTPLRRQRRQDEQTAQHGRGMAAGRKHAVPLRPARLLLGAALLHSARSEDLFRACPTEHVRGVLFHFESSYEIYNNLGGYPGGDGVDCLESRALLEVLWAIRQTNLTSSAALDAAKGSHQCLLLLA